MARRRCRGNCGRWLTDEESIARGYGPVCAERLGLTVKQPARSRLPTTRIDTTPDQIPGQVALPLVDHQPTLWSL